MWGKWGGLVLVVVLVAAAYFVGRKDRGSSDAAEAWVERTEHLLGLQREAFEANRVALVAYADSAEARARRHVAAAVAVASTPLPVPDLEPASTASDSVAYWRARTDRAETEAGEWKAAYMSQMEATVRLRAAVDADSARIRELETQLKVGVPLVGCRIDLVVAHVGCPSRGVMLGVGVLAGFVIGRS